MAGRVLMIFEFACVCRKMCYVYLNQRGTGFGCRGDFFLKGRNVHFECVILQFKILII